MGKADGVTKEYIRNPKIFADICNWILFEGRTIILPENLSEKDTTEIGILKDTILIQRYRDTLKKWVVMESTSSTIAILGIENQTDIDYTMTVRNILYDTINYQAQINNICKRNISSRRVSAKAPKYKQFLKDDRLKPVITIVVYWGNKPWDGARNFHELLDFSEHFDFKKYVINYHIPLIVPAEIEDFSNFSTELGCVLAFIKNSQSKQGIQDVLDKYHNEFSCMDSSSFNVINTITDLNISLEGGTINMCKAWDDHYKDGITTGIIETAKKMLKRGMSLSDISEITELSEEYLKTIETEISIPT